LVGPPVTDEKARAVAIDGLPRLDSGKHPFELFILVLGLISGGPLLFGKIRPGSTEELLNPVMLQIWAWMLVTGCAVALVGALWRWQVTTGLLLEQLGLVAVGAGVVIYTASLLYAGTGRFLSAAIIGGFGLACLWRVWQIQRWVRAVVRLSEHQAPPGDQP
jgi:hypothetical protein